MNIDSLPVSDFMTTEIITATEDETIQRVCKTMSEHHIGSIVIVKRTISGNKPIGIITERDIVHQIGLSDVFLVEKPIREVMNYPLITTGPTNSVREAIETMNIKNIRRLLVVDDDDKIVGILTEKDLFKAISNPESQKSSDQSQV
jgi:CBS domain-containing protein